MRISEPTLQNRQRRRWLKFAAAGFGAACLSPGRLFAQQQPALLPTTQDMEEQFATEYLGDLEHEDDLRADRLERSSEENAIRTDLILIPGLLCDARLWKAQTADLAASTRSHVSDLATYDSIPAMADAVLDQAPSTFSLAGFSLGGAVALEIYARAPQRVQRLALLSTNASGITPMVREHLAASISGLEAGRLDAYLADAFPRYVAPDRVHDRTLQNTFDAMAKDVGAADGVRQMRALLNYPGFGGDLGAIRCPTTVICGREDQRIPVPIHERTARAIPGATLHVIEDSGHFTPLEQPGAVTAAVRAWLNA
jgi:pimeloyl-ACP methyl ester carboxylesterase